jgi:hypothetical protein
MNKTATRAKSRISCVTVKFAPAPAPPPEPELAVEVELDVGMGMVVVIVFVRVGVMVVVGLGKVMVVAKYVEKVVGAVIIVLKPASAAGLLTTGTDGRMLGWSSVSASVVEGLSVTVTIS